MSIPPAKNSTMELQQMDVPAAAIPAISGWSERAKWLLSSPNPPPAWQELYISMKETLCPQTKEKEPGQPNCCFLFLQNLFPILKWGKNYKATKFKKDFMAGLTLASLCIPQVCLKHQEKKKLKFPSKTETKIFAEHRIC